MTQRTTLTAALVAVTTLAGAQLAGWGTAQANAQAAAEPRNPGIVRLQADATDGLRIERNAAGVADFVGTMAGNEVVNPAVSAATGVGAAAQSHLARYGAALGLASDAELSITRSERSVSGQDVVRFQQEVDSVPVIGGQVVVSLRGDRQLSSLLSTVSTLRSLPTATVTEAAARTAASSAAGRAAGDGDLTTTDQGRAVWDPAIFGATGAPAQGVWKFEVGDGAGVRRLVLVDDTSGRVLVNQDQIEHIDRVVCDKANVRDAGVPAQAPCTSGFARTETGVVSPTVDVNAAFDNAGSVSTAYSQIAGIDLTDKLGVATPSGKKLAATVRYCPPTAQQGGCPYANAFWNGTQMFYGNTYAGADDVVGHEMTHGVVDQYSELLYWGQSGAINESMADIMGEIVDHRAGYVQATDDNWLLGEDLPIGAIRNMKNPPAFNDPDKMTSPNYTADLSWSSVAYPDSGGVHQNSGVGNKTAYLISQGGTFNGQTITGIDGTDTGLTKTGQLYFDAITKLTSGSDYANLAAVLEQSCADFVTSGKPGFTAGDCANVARAVLATELRTTPTNAPQPPDAVKSCPTGTTLRELFNSETGAPATKFTQTDGLWGYGVNADWGSNATSGKDSWFGYNPDPFNYGDPSFASLTMAPGIATPPGQSTYLYFQQWRVFQWAPGSVPRYFDGGTVEIDAGSGAIDASTMPWVNGPQQTLEAFSPSVANPWAGRKAFAGDSFGWTASQLDLTSLAGQTIKPSFSLRGDARNSFIGWWLDDIVVYTCDVPAPPTTPPTTPPGPTATPTPTPTPTPTVPPVVMVGTTTKLTVKPGKTVKVIATVKAASGASPTGKVTFKIDNNAITKTVTLKNGKATLKLSKKNLNKLGQGKHKVKAAYAGSATTRPSTGKASFNLR